MNNVIRPMRNVLLGQQDRQSGKYSSDSCLFPGHEERMAYHIMRVHNHPCPCGSGVRFGECCLGRHRCKRCRREFIPADGAAAACPACGSDQTVVVQLREACG